jgi:hypothetical protein
LYYFNDAKGNSFKFKPDQNDQNDNHNGDTILGDNYNYNSILVKQVLWVFKHSIYGTSKKSMKSKDQKI